MQSVVEYDLFKLMIDVREHPEVIEAINKVLNSRGIAEVKNEIRKGEDNLVVVEITRTLKTKKKTREE